MIQYPKYESFPFTYHKRQNSKNNSLLADINWISNSSNSLPPHKPILQYSTELSLAIASVIHKENGFHFLFSSPPSTHHHRRLRSLLVAAPSGLRQSPSPASLPGPKAGCQRRRQCCRFSSFGSHCSYWCCCTWL